MMNMLAQPNVLLLVRELRVVIIWPRINGSSLQQGDVHYYVRLNDQRIWKKNVDQLRRVGKLVTQHNDKFKQPFKGFSILVTK